jgi:uncharacterized Zn finger protein
MSYSEFEKRSRIRVADGIKSQTTVHRMNWWAKRWLEALQQVGLGSRLTRGRTYARSGQVLSINVASGQVQSDVQGSRPTPYRVTLRLKVNPPEVWDRLLARLEGDIGIVARMMAGDLPDSLEPLFAEEGAALFPASNDLATACSCPDWENPCKHSAAVCYLIAEELHRDPFVLLQLRGMDRQGILHRIAPAAGAGAAAETEAATDPEEPLPCDAQAFWAAKPIPPGLLAASPLPKGLVCAAHGLGPFPLWRGQETPADFTDRMCADAAVTAQAIWSGEAGADE